ncbi:GNAT family N-acetyltransferase [Streptomyces roseirectus]|uniref:GNAT family N-acetyltransferase n=1 Tax=Streptomyces roseirectus TaxID=2768066 RepID=A0A7H0ISP1_9ACTN|nr:GNAT family N-acetyltransferase [Streptomyces roseirectus]QNP75807.1 GNAT family N-acetyltransferase [Streptomyces roseirectus]
MDSHPPFETLHNFRDLGGYPTRDGRRVRPGLLYRSDSLGKLTEGTPDWHRFRALGIGTVIDLRDPEEATHRGRVPQDGSFAYHHLNMEPHSPDRSAQPARSEALAPNPAPDLGPHLAQRYLKTAEEGRKEIATALRLIADAHTPVAFHCVSGKDRTGLLAALLLTLLDVPDEVVIEDYSRTELATAALLADWHATETTPPWPSFGRAPATAMRLFLREFTARHGSVDRYVEKSLALDPVPLRNALRTRYLTDPHHPTPAPHSPLTYRRATPEDAPLLVRLRDTAALWQLARGIVQWQPGEKTEAHFRTRMAEGEVWLAESDGVTAGAYELWWTDKPAWGPRPDDAGYIHRLMTVPHTAPPGTGRHLLTHAESRIAAAGRPWARLDCLSTNPRLREYYESAGYQVVGEQRAKADGPGSPYAVTLMEKRLP